MDYIEIIRKALEDLISDQNIDDIIYNDNDDNLIEVSFYNFDDFLAEIESFKDCGKNFKIELANLIDDNIKVIISLNKELLLIKFLND